MASCRLVGSRPLCRRMQRVVCDPNYENERTQNYGTGEFCVSHRGWRSSRSDCIQYPPFVIPFSGGPMPRRFVSFLLLLVALSFDVAVDRWSVIVSPSRT